MDDGRQALLCSSQFFHFENFEFQESILLWWTKSVQKNHFPSEEWEGIGQTNDDTIDNEV